MQLDGWIGAGVWLVVSNMFYFQPGSLGKMNTFCLIFQMGGSTTNYSQCCGCFSCILVSHLSKNSPAGASLNGPPRT